MKAADGSWTGISIELWRHVANDLHLQYRFEERTLQQLVDDTAARSLDAAVAALTVTAERERVVDFTQPFYTTGLGIAVPRNAVFAWWQLLRSFLSVGFLGALLALVGVTLAIGSLVWLFERRQTEHFGGGLKTGLMSGIWWSALTMTQAGPDKGPQTAAGRVVAITWMTTSVIVISIFTAGITSQFTARQLQGVVHELGDLRSVRVGVVGGTAALSYLTRARIDFRVLATPQDGLTALRAGKLDAFVYDRPLLAWLAKEGFGGSVQVLDAIFDRQSYAIALPMGSPLRTPINEVMVEAVRTEWWQDLIQKYIGKE
jgi:ABC-type amino acid transport substrate-binding protein